MCREREICSFYLKYQNCQNLLVKGMVEKYCENQESTEPCRRELIHRFYGLDLAPSVSPAGELLESN